MTREVSCVCAGMALAVCSDMATKYDTVQRLLPLSWPELASLFDDSSLHRLKQVWARDDVTALVLFENQQRDSASYGDRSAVAVGPGCTYKTIAEVAGGYLNDVLDEKQQAVAYAAKASDAKLSKLRVVSL